MIAISSAFTIFTLVAYIVFLRFKIQKINRFVINMDSEQVHIKRKVYDNFIRSWGRRSRQYRRRNSIIRKLIIDNSFMKKELKQIDFLQRCMARAFSLSNRE
jgi:hypothetical protein